MSLLPPTQELKDLDVYAESGGLELIMNCDARSIFVEAVANAIRCSCHRIWRGNGSVGYTCKRLLIPDSAAGMGRIELEKMLFIVDAHWQRLIIAHKTAQSEALDQKQMKAHKKFLDAVEP